MFSLFTNLFLLRMGRGAKVGIPFLLFTVNQVRLLATKSHAELQREEEEEEEFSS